MTRFSMVRTPAERPGGSSRPKKSFRRRVEPAVAAHTDYNSEKPGASLLTKSSRVRMHGGPSWEVFDYPGEYVDSGDGARYARLRIEELHRGTAVGI